MFFISSVKLHHHIIMFHIKPTPLSVSKKKKKLMFGQFEVCLSLNFQSFWNCDFVLDIFIYLCEATFLALMIIKSKYR